VTLSGRTQCRHLTATIESSLRQSSETCLGRRGHVHDEEAWHQQDIALEGYREKRLSRIRLSSDAGSQYTSIAYTERLDDIGAAPSIGTVGDSYDNALAESVMGLYKTELHRNPAVLAANGGHWKGLEDLETAICAWVSWFNSERLHSELGDCTPDEVEAVWRASRAA